MWAGVRSWNSSTSKQARIALGPMTKTGVGQQAVDRPDDLLVEVGLVALTEEIPVPDRHIIEADDVGQIADDILGMLEPQANPTERLDPGGHRIGLDLSRQVDQGGEQIPDLRFLDRADSVRQEPQPEGVERPHPQLGQVRGAVLEFLGRPAVEGDHGDGVGRKTPCRSASSRALSVRTLVFPDPAGAMIRAPPPGCRTAAS